MQPQVLGSTSTGAVLTVSEAELMASRVRVSAFLSAHTVYELLPESGKVWLHLHLPTQKRLY